MSPEAPLAAPESRPANGRRLRPVFLATALGLAAVVGWLAWPSQPETSPYDLSRADGKSRFYATTFSRTERPANLTFTRRLSWAWDQFHQRFKKRNPAAYLFGRSPVQLRGIAPLLNECMDLTGTQYLLAVEIAGVVPFGNSNALNGAQWAAAVEQAIETSGPVICYDFATRRNFEDTLLLIRETPRLVKVVPRTKLDEYKKAGLVKSEVRSPRAF